MLKALYRGDQAMFVRSIICLTVAMLWAQPAIAQDALCEVIIDEDGTTDLMPCCDLTPDYRILRGNRGRNGKNTEVTYDDCELAKSAINNRSLAEVQYSIQRRLTLSVAKFLRANPGPVGFGFTVKQPTYTLETYCCTCVPGENCSALIADVCTATTDGMCPSGTLRTVCSYSADSGATCTGID